MKLTIKRVPTVLSNYQEEGGGAGCGRNCLGDCCLPASKLPLYAFKASNQNKFAQEDGLPTDFFLNSLLLGQVVQLRTFLLTKDHIDVRSHTTS